MIHKPKTRTKPVGQEQSKIGLLRKIIREELLKESPIPLDPDGDEEKAGIAGRKLAAACGWDGHMISLAYLEALTDANFHRERKKIAPMINKMLGTNFPIEG